MFTALPSSLLDYIPAHLVDDVPKREGEGSQEEPNIKQEELIPARTEPVQRPDTWRLKKKKRSRLLLG